ncbi:MAG: hypothetical protein ACT4P6_11070 [Gemmatimonadaceae bacterium]
MNCRRVGITLLEVLVCLTILMTVTAVVTLSALQPLPRSAADATRAACTRAAIRDRRTVTVDLANAFALCRPDGRVIAAGREFLTGKWEP